VHHHALIQFGTPWSSDACAAFRRHHIYAILAWVIALEPGSHLRYATDMNGMPHAAKPIGRTIRRKTVSRAAANCALPAFVGVSVLAPALAALPLSAATAPKPGPPAIVSIQTRDLEVEFAGDRAWTIHRILFKNALVADKRGFYGTVFAAEGGKWIGTGHNEGGIEKVHSAILTIDGVERPLTDKAVYRARRAEIKKRSTIGPLLLEAACIVTDDALLERHAYEVTSDVKISILYAFMHAWLPSTTEWIAEKADGSLLEGTFDNAGDFEVKDDVKWASLYDPGTEVAMMAWYPKPLVGQGIKTAYWDKTVYHKLYNQIYSHASVPAGARFEASMVVRGVKTDAASWKTAARELAAQTSQAFATGDLRF